MRFNSGFSMSKIYSLLLVSVLALSASGVAAPTKFFGKTGPQAVKLGLDGWVGYVQKQKGGNTEKNTIGALNFYASARKAANKAAMSKLTKWQATALENIAGKLTAAGLALNKAESTAGLGGEYYDVEAARRPAVVQEVIHLVLVKKSAREMLVTGNQFAEIIDAWKEDLSLTAKDNQSTKAVAPMEKAALKSVDDARTAISTFDENPGNLFRMTLAHFMSGGAYKRPF